MPFAVYLTNNAARDLEDIYDYISEHDTPLKAACVLDKIEEAFSRLSETSQRGAFPKELLELGIKEYRQVFFKPYRAIYRVMEEAVYIVLIADGRRDMAALLQRRLLED